MDKKPNKTTTRIVAIGGGHGLGRVLSALDDLGENITGIVTTTDNGGSTGRIRACQGGIAWGDMRNCINQLITKPSTGSMLFEYRFKGNGELDGHNLGNLILTALSNLSIRPLDAINLIRDMLHVSTQILPMSEHPADLLAFTQHGERITGEKNIDDLSEVPARLMLDPIVPATNETILAIRNSTLIILGPGSFMTSVMPPLLLPEIGKALGHAKAPIVFIQNLATEHGPSGQMSLKGMLAWCERAMNGRKVDILLGQKKHTDVSKDYRQVVTDLASANHLWRHDREKLSNAIKQLIT